MDLGDLISSEKPSKKRRRAGARGRASGSRSTDPKECSEIALADSLRASALYGKSPDGQGTPLIHREAVREVLRRDPTGRSVVFLIDCSDSMAASRRIAAAKGAALSLLKRSRITGDRVAVVLFRETYGEVVLPPTRSTARAKRALAALRTGGATPMAAGLQAANRVLEAERISHHDSRRLLILLSDGEANVPLTKGGDLKSELESLARRAGASAHVFVLDTGREDSAILHHVAVASAGVYRRIVDVAGKAVLDIMAEPGGGRRPP